MGKFNNLNELFLAAVCLVFCIYDIGNENFPGAIFWGVLVIIKFGLFLPDTKEY